MSTRKGELFVYVGCYGGGSSPGIVVYRLDTTSGALEPLGSAQAENASFLAIDRARQRLYATNEFGELPWKPDGAVSAYSIGPGAGDLTLLNQQSSRGGSPCYVAIDKTGRFVLASNYGGGSVIVLPILEDGRLGEATSFVQHSREEDDGKGGFKQPRAHSVILDPSNRYAIAADLGLDRVMIYRFDQETGKLTPNDQPWVQFRSGAGPRHSSFHPSGRFLYVIDETDSTIVALACEQTSGTLEELQALSTLPGSWQGQTYCAEVQVSPSGRLVYGSNRGHDSIVIYAIDQETGRLALVGHQSTLGAVPRHFAIDPSGRLLLAANQNSNALISFWVDGETGALTPTGRVTEVARPACVRIVGASA